MNSITDEIKPLGPELRKGDIFYHRCKAGYWLEKWDGEGMSVNYDTFMEFFYLPIKEQEKWWKDNF